MKLLVPAVLLEGIPSQNRENRGNATTKGPKQIIKEPEVAAWDFQRKLIYTYKENLLPKQSSYHKRASLALNNLQSPSQGQVTSERLSPYLTHARTAGRPVWPGLL